MRKINKFYYILLISSLANSIEIYAREPFQNSFRSIENTQRVLELQQQQKYINEQLNYPNQVKYVKPEKEQVKIPEGKKYKFKVIELQTSDGKEVKLYRREVRKIIQKYIVKEIGKKEIYELLSELSNFYLSKGYMTTLVTIKSGNVKKGELIYELKEGRLNEISFMNRSTTLLDKARIFLAFPIRKNGLINTRDMDQGLENINIGGNNDLTEISPTKMYGYSDILIEENYNPTGFGFGLDNSGYEDKGSAKLNVNFSQDNILGINDNLTLNYIERITKKRNLDKEANYDVGYSILFGYWSLGYSFNYGDNYNTTISELGKYLSESRVQKHKIKLRRTIYRGEYSKSNFHTSFTYKDNYNTMNGVVLSVSTKKYANISVGIDYTTRLLGGTIFGMLEYERGVPWLGATGDPKVIPSGAYVNEYNKISINIDWQRPFSILKNDFQYKAKIGGAYSDDRLSSANQFSMGDEYTVRGFKESSVSGNKGIYINNTLTYKWNRGVNRYIEMFKPFIGIDAGISRDRDLQQEDIIVGAAIGIQFSIGGLNGSFTYSVPLKRAEGMPKEGNPIYFNINYNL